MSTPALQAALNFTDEDLVANRAGRLGPTQQARMTKLKGRGQIINIVYAVMFAVIIGVIALFVIPQYTAAADAGSSSAVPTWLIAAIIAGVVLIIGFTVLRTRRRLTRLDGAVLMTEGEANGRQGLVPMAETAMAPIFRLSIGKVTFALSTPEPLAAFTNGKRYRGYYVKGTMPVLVSAEEI